jgi:membrane-bound serine protease (ClpP class)
LFLDAKGWPAVNPILAGIVSILCGGFIWIATDRALAAQQAKPVMDPDSLVGKIGEARTAISDDGSVQVGAELWSARSQDPIAKGSTVRVTQRDGFVLIVEKVSI